MVKYLKSSVIRRTHIALCDIINNVFSWKTCNDAGLACAVVAAYHALHRVVLTFEFKFISFILYHPKIKLIFTVHQVDVILYVLHDIVVQVYSLLLVLSYCPSEQYIRMKDVFLV